MRSDQSGFTLIEVLIAVILLSLLAVAASLLLTTVLKLSVETQTGVAIARSTELTIAYFNDDVRNSTTIATTGTILCQSSTPGTDTRVIELAGSTFGPDVTTVATYVIRDIGGGSMQLYRLKCSSNVVSPPYPATLTATSEAGLDLLQAPAPPNPVATCRDTAGATVVCTPLTTSAVSATLDVTPAGGTSYTVKGVRRTSS